jgi:predicted adenylyl cyclase CyaB
MREVELKAVVDDLAGTRKRLEKAGAKLVFEGSLSDRRYDVESRELLERDEVLRVRRYQTPSSSKTYLDWKGPTEIRDVYKIREEISTLAEDFDSLQQILTRLGFIVTMEIDREIAQYELGGATIRFETYPRMDVLVEVEGEPESIEVAIEALGMPRGLFNSDRLTSFVGRFEQRTGVQAALCARELEGDYGLRSDDIRTS